MLKYLLFTRDKIIIALLTSQPRGLLVSNQILSFGFSFRCLAWVDANLVGASWHPEPSRNNHGPGLRECSCSSYYISHADVGTFQVSHGFI